MNAPELVRKVEEIGGVLMLRGDRIRYELPEDAAPLLEILRFQREEVKAILRQRQHTVPPALPPGLRLVSWQPKEPPVVITRWSIVTNVPMFVETTLRQLAHAVKGDKPFLAGNWSVRDLVDRLEQVGLKVQIESPKS